MDLRPYSKAIGGALAGLIVMYLTKHNIIISDNLNDALEIVIGTAIVALGVWLSPKNTEVK